MSQAAEPNMLCQRCQKSLRNYEGIKCGACESRYHLKCISNPKDIELERGDRGFHWVCATCQNPTNKHDPDVLLNAIKVLTEKFELVNKIQLPKLNNDLLHIKSVTESLVKQNEEILFKIDKLKSKKVEQSKTYRWRNLELSPRTNRGEDRNSICDENIPIMGADKVVRYKTRRRSYPILKILLQLNRRLNRRTPRRK